MNSSIKKIYFFSLLLFILPSFNLVLVYSYGLGKLLLGLAVFLIIFQILNNKITLNFDNRLSSLFTLFFIAQALSVITVMDIGLFLSRFKDLIFIFLFFFCSMYIFQKRENNKNFVVILFVVLLFNLVSEILVFFYPQIYIDIATKILNPGNVNLIAFNVDRQRIYLGTYNEIMIPIIIYLYIYGRKKITLPLLPLIIAVSFLSDFRTKFLMSAFAFVASLIAFIKKGKKNNFMQLSLFLISLVMVALVAAYSFASATQSQTLVNRLLFQSNTQDVLTVQERIQKWEDAITIGFGSPVFGVGLGNYNYYVENKPTYIYYSSYQQIQTDLLNPHDLIVFIFAETGLLGLGAFLLLLLYFITEDTKIFFHEKNEFAKALIISFWTLFIYSLFNPTTDFSYNILFWLLRVVIFYESANRRAHDWLK